MKAVIADQELETALPKYLSDHGIPACPVCAEGLPLRKIRSKKDLNNPARHAAAHLEAKSRIEEPFDVWLMIAALENLMLVPDEHGTGWRPLDESFRNLSFELVRGFIHANVGAIRDAGFRIDSRGYRNEDLGYERSCALVDPGIWHLLLTMASATQPAASTDGMTAAQERRWIANFTKDARALLADTKRVLAEPSPTPDTCPVSG